MGVDLNQFEALATASLSGWTETLNPTASRALATITCTGGSLYYSRSDLNLDGPNAFALEAVVSAEGLSVDGERGARMWVKWFDTGASAGDVYHAEIRLIREVGVYKIKLFDVNTGLAVASLNQPWSTGPIRVRIKRQEVAGTNYVLLQAESAAGWDNKSTPNELNDPPSSVAVLLSSFVAAFGSSEIGFGNYVAGGYYSDWASVHVTRCDAVADVLPYWPPTPATPTLSLNGASASPHEIQAAVDTSGFTVTNDTVRGTLTTVKDGPQSDGAQATGGTVTFIYPSLSDDQDVTGTVIAVEVSGRETTGAASGPYTIPDLTAPAQPVITSPASGTKTNDTTPTLSGTAEADADVEIFDGATPIGTDRATLAGNWTITPGVGLANGSHNLTAVATDQAGNPSPASTIVIVEIDTVAPAAPVIATPPTGTFTNDQTPTLVGTAEADASVEVFDGGTPLGTVLADGSGNWTFTPGGNLTEAAHSLTAVATDEAGNPSGASATTVVTVDITAPAQPAITSPASGTETNDQTPTLTGTAEADTLIEVFDGPTSLGFVLADGSGNWTFTPGGNLTEAAHSFTIVATDMAGNPSVPSAATIVTIDTTAPGQPTITSPASGTETNDQTPSLTGTAEADSSVEVFDGVTSLGTTTADGSGNWTFTPGANLTEASHTITVVATDAAGNPSAASAPVVVIVDITPPSLPTIDTPDPAYYFWTNNQQPPLTGTAEADSSVEVFDGVTSLGTVTADSAGDWSFTPAAPLSVGLHTFTVVATDAAGNPSLSSAAADVEIRTALPDAEIMVTSDVGVAFTSQTWNVPTNPQDFTVPIEVGVRVNQDTFDYLDYEFASNPLVAQTPTHQPPSKLMVKLPGAGAFVDYYLDETTDFALHSIGSPTITHWMFVFKDGGGTPRVFTEDGDLELQAFIQDFATNQRTRPDAPPLTLDIDIPPEGEVVIKVSPSTTYNTVTTPILARPVVPAIRSAHSDIDGPNSSITITQTSPAQSITVPLGAATPVGSEYIYEPTNLTPFPGGATIDLDGDFTIDASIQDGDTPPNTNQIAISSSFVIDTVIPTAECWVSTTYGGTYSLAQPSYTAGPLWVALAIPTSTTDVNTATSTFNVQPTTTAGPLFLDDASLTPIVQSGHNLYRWPTAFSTVGGMCTIDYLLNDNAGQTLGAQQCTFTLGQPLFEISSSGILLSHTHDDGTNTDPNNEMLTGATNHNYMGVRIQNVGSGSGDCSYRIFIVPKYLFSNADDWILVDEGDPAPVVPAIPTSGPKNSTSNRDFLQDVVPPGHPNFPSDVDLFGGGAPVGSIVHTCTAAVLHASADKLEVVDGSGTPVTITDSQFNDPAQFKTAVMDIIADYDGGGYWVAVQSNVKIANKNFNFKKTA